MDDVSVFWADWCSIKELEKACIVFGKASGSKINRAKSDTLLLGYWTPTRDPLPNPIKQDFVKILGVWFGGEGVVEKSWKETLAKTKQKLGLWSFRKLMIEGKSLVLRNKTLPVLQNHLVVGKKETSTLGCRKMIHSLLHDYTAMDGSDDDSVNET
ncbi:hypothetical protein NDU88_011116 [Pleurodeles waltl]|uniref:Reverse transcriptase domain-containing protein n=1 Tax=Pleurodeles waltl TaxID=8319 RepID=A0AAV7QWA7_PLEWA|nr:hypothetical protein NDU88_011116 [Pleurodeles waltl]